VKRQTTIIAAHILAVGALAAFAACGGSDGPNAPGSTPSGSPGPSGATITIANGRVTPSEVTIAVGQSVTFVNNDSTGHNVSSDPHPNHTDCPAVNAVNNLGTGQTRLTNAFTTGRVCGFHDHDLPDNANLKGRITIQ
jgi:plastocyanin